MAAGMMISVMTGTGNMIQIDIDPNDTVMRIKVTQHSCQPSAADYSTV